MKITGETQGVKKYILDELDSLIDSTYDKATPVDAALAQRVLAISIEINREIALLINRNGSIRALSLGDHAKVALPDVGGRRSEQSLSGLRCIHTHPSGSVMLSPQDYSSLQANRYDIIAALAIDNNETLAAFSYLDGDFAPQDGGVLKLDDFCELNMPLLCEVLDKQFAKSALANEEHAIEQAVLVGVDAGARDIDASLDELELLADTAGAVVVGRLIQRRSKVDSALYIGQGKAAELHALCQNTSARTVIFDDELSPAQQRNLEAALGLKVVDRTALILDIFAQRARSHEGKIQVELAQLRYGLTRLYGLGIVLSRLGGGIGTRGPGETKLEVDRRKIRKRISDLERETKDIVKRRELLRERRTNSNITTIALVGYTNAGKSTLMNTLTAAGVLAEDKLFATLDPTTRKYELPSGTPLLVTDTVGFITKLPHTLIKAFRATLEETLHADLLLHIVDAASSEADIQCQAVAHTLEELGVKDKAIITVYNKIDKNLSPEHIQRLLLRPDSVAISALRGDNLELLVRALEQFTAKRSQQVTLLIPYDKTAVINRLFEIATVLAQDYEESGIRVHALIRPEWLEFVSSYVDEAEIEISQ